MFCKVPGAKHLRVTIFGAILEKESMLFTVWVTGGNACLGSEHKNLGAVDGLQNK